MERNFTSTLMCCDKEYVIISLNNMVEDLLKKLGKDIPEPGQIVEIPLLIPSPENTFISAKIVVEGKEFKHVEQKYPFLKLRDEL